MSKEEQVLELASNGGFALKTIAHFTHLPYKEVCRIIYQSDVRLSDWRMARSPWARAQVQSIIGRLKAAYG